MRDIFDKQNNGSLIMRIAIADDEADVVSFLKSIIDEMGHTSVTFSDGLAVGQSLVRETYDLLILDWSMPKRDGLETLKWMQDSLTERPPVIMLTARSAKKDISDARKKPGSLLDHQCGSRLGKNSYPLWSALRPV